ncbi:glycosyltransferase [Streptomyces sp. ODS28]|uniref:glycosyltransferase n=1 Tax=Streptomyces sp. ODS28 TaxID=3136688 RepID=UPI0031ECF8A5
MRVALMTAGSRGDVAPYTGLAHRLAQAGYGVTLATHGSFAETARVPGVDFHPLPVDPRAELAGERGRALERSSTGAAKLLRLASMARELTGSMTDGMLEAARGSDVLLLSGSLAPVGHAIAEGLRLPSMGVYLQPLAPTRDFAAPVLGTRSWGAAGNRLSGSALNAVVESIFADAGRTVRSRLGLPRSGPYRARRDRERRNWPVLHGFSPLVVPRPRDWRSGLTVTGYWWPYDEPEGQLPVRVREFLAAGPPPVFVGLGSATVPDPEWISALMVAALRRAGLRGVIQGGWSGLRGEGEGLLTVGELPHTLLFPHMAAVVHHCGAGTTAAGLRAGVPAVPVPVQFDEGFWACRLTGLGVAPRALPLRRLTADALAAALTEVTADPGYQKRATALAARLAAEDGPAPVLRAVERHAARA